MRLLIFVGLLAVYILTMPTVAQFSGDAAAEFARARADGGPLRSNHLLFTPAMRAAFHIADRLGAPGPQFLHLQIVTAIAGALASVFLLASLRRIGCRLRVALPLTLILAFSHGHWLHSREIDTDIIPESLLLGALFLLTGLATPSIPLRSAPSARLIGLAAGLLAAGAALFSANFALLAPGLVLLIFLIAPPNLRLHGTLAFAAAIGVVIPAALVLAYIMTSGEVTMSGFFGWILAHPEQRGLAGTGRVELASVLRAASGLLNYFAGENSLTTAIKQLLRGSHGVPIHVADFGRLGIGLVATGTIFLASVPLLFAGEKRSWVFAVAAVILPACIFNVLWLGSDPQFWIPVVPFLLWGVGLAATIGRRAKFASSGVLFAVAGLLFLCNVFYPVPTLTRPNGGAAWRKATAFANASGPEDLIVYPASGWPRLLRYCGQCRELNLYYASGPADTAGRLQLLVDEIKDRLDNGGRVFAYDVFDLQEPASVGYWEMLQSAYGVQRSTVVGLLTEKYTRRDLPEKQWQGMVELLLTKPTSLDPR